MDVHNKGGHERMRKDEFSPRQIQNIFLRANRKHKNDEGERFVDFKTLSVDMPFKLQRSLAKML